MADTTSILTGGSNNFQTTAEHLNYPATDFFANGVVGAITNTSGVAPATGGLACNAQGTPNMTVAVSAGVAYVTATPTGQASQRLRANIAAQNATIASNSTGGTRYDWIYVKIDPTNANTPNAAGDNVASIVVSRSTSASTDNGTPPTYGYNIAIVTVANGAASITNGNIADSRAQTGANAASTGAIGPTALSTGAITLGYAQVTSTQTGIGGSDTDLTGLTVTVTVPAGGRRIFIHGHITANGSTANLAELDIKEGSTILNKVRHPMNGTGGWTIPMDVFYSTTASAGSHTYKLTMNTSAGGGTVETAGVAADQPSFILVTAI